MKRGIIFRRFANAPGQYEITSRPLAEMNITPLIDVMLVLLVMMILIMPVATHTVPVDLPTNGGITAEPQIQTLLLAENGATWDSYFRCRAIGKADCFCRRRG